MTKGTSVEFFSPIENRWQKAVVTGHYYDPFTYEYYVVVEYKDRATTVVQTIKEEMLRSLDSIECMCGADKCNHPFHSQFCPKDDKGRYKV